MAQLMTSLDIENDTQKKHIQELEQFVLLLSTALTPEGDSHSINSNKNEADLVRQFANQFNINIKMDNFDKAQKKKKDPSKLSDKISQALARMDLLLKENFELKREIVFERKKFIDLQTSFNDFKMSVVKQSENVVEGQSPNKSMNSSVFQGGSGNMRPSTKSSLYD